MIKPGEQVETPDEEVEDIEVPEEETSAAAPKQIDLDEEEENERVAKLGQSDKNKAFAAMRKEAADAKRERDEFKRKVAEYEERMARPAAPAPVPVQAAPVVHREYIGGVPVPVTPEEWDVLARKDWRTAIDLRAVIKAREIQQEVRATDTHTRVLEETKQKVLQKHPELDDMNSAKSVAFRQVLEQNPEYLKMPKGPLYAMREMEEMLQAQGHTPEQIFDSKGAANRAEAARVARGALTTGGRMPEKQGRTVQLSKDDLEFCKKHDLDPKDYAREKLAMDNGRKGAQL